jgi:hypothetical protein
MAKAKCYIIQEPGGNRAHAVRDLLDIVAPVSAFIYLASSLDPVPWYGIKVNLNRLILESELEIGLGRRGSWTKNPSLKPGDQISSGEADGSVSGSGERAKADWECQAAIA